MLPREADPLAPPSSSPSTRPYSTHWGILPQPAARRSPSVDTTCVLQPPNSRLLSDAVVRGVLHRRDGLYAPQRTGNMNTWGQQWTLQNDQHGSSRQPLGYAELGATSTTRAVGGWRPTAQGNRSIRAPADTESKRQRPKGVPSAFQGDSETQQHYTRTAEPTTRETRVVAMAELAAAEKLRLRELRRVRQIRYRKKKENYMHTLEDDTRQLRDEIKQLEQRQRSVSAAVPAKESAWCVAAEYFRLFRYGVSEAATATATASSSSLSSSRELQSSAQLDFLRASMAPDVAFNNERGIEAVMRTWSCVSRWFAALEVVLERLEKDASGSLVAITITTVTITEQTVRAVFHHLSTRDVRLGSAASCLAERLVDQRISMRGRTRFEWDDAYCRVTSMNSEADMLTPMLRLVGSLEDVSSVFEGALVTPDFRLKSVV